MLSLVAISAQSTRHTPPSGCIVVWDFLLNNPPQTKRERHYYRKEMRSNEKGITVKLKE
jgi:hypothetical protein